MSLIWATRGRTWGFRFVRNAEMVDPLPVYEVAFSGIEDEPEVCRRRDATVALRFIDPCGRKDQSGRVILHEFVITGDTTEGLNSTEDGLQRIWPLVAGEFERIYDLHRPPPAQH